MNNTHSCIQLLNNNNNNNNNSDPIVVYFHVGPNLVQPKRLTESIRQVMPNAKIILCSDFETPEIECDIRVDTIIDRNKLMTARLSSFAELGLNRTAMYIDTDMVFLEQVYPEKILGNSNVVLCRRSFSRNGLFETNQRGLCFIEHSGKLLDTVFPYLACFTVTPNSDFWKELLCIHEQLDPKYHAWYGDQESMRIYAELYRVSTVDESEYACLPEKNVNGDYSAKILHYKGNRKVCGLQRQANEKGLIPR
jgi:hypothetical protein